VFSHPSLLIDVLASGWVVLVFILLFGYLPTIAFPQRSIPSWSSRLVGAFVRTVAIVAIGSMLWTKLGLFTWIVAVLVYGTGLSIGWIASHQWQYRQPVRQLAQQLAISTVDIFDRGLSMPQLQQWLLWPWQFIEQSIQARIDRSKSGLPLVILSAIATFSLLLLAVGLRFEHPLTEFRFAHPDTYGQLLFAQKILARDLLPVDRLPLFPSLAAFVTAVSGVHPLHVVHLLGAIVGTLLVLSIGYLLRCLTHNGAATFAATYSLGVYLFTWQLPISTQLPLGVQQCLHVLKDTLDRGLIRSWAVSEFELGALFAILAIGCSTHLHRSAQRTEAIVNTLCCVLLVAAIAPSLLILLLFGSFGMIFGRQMALFTLSTAWTILAVLAATESIGGASPLEQRFPLLTGILATLPIGLSLLVGLLFIAIATAGRLLLANWSAPICLTVFIAITLNFWLPPLPAIDYLEYDAAARKAVEIGHLFPRHQWTVVAPIEQLSQVYGRGWYEDAAVFTAKYQDLVTAPSFHFPHPTPLLIFTEKRPFIPDKPEYPVPYSVLIDPTYRHYRSPSGRTQLESSLLRLCETYRRQHPDLYRIYYENDRLRIYQFSPVSIDNKKPQLTNKGKLGTNNQGASTTPISTRSIARSGRILNLFSTPKKTPQPTN
jgi:hypothetical protein